MSDTIVKVQPYSVDLADPIKKTYLDTLFASQDNEADRFDISLFRDHAQEKLPSTAAVSAYFIRYSDNATVIHTGSKSGNVASVTLKQACYNKPGQFALIIKVTVDGVISTVFYGEGTIFASSTDTIVNDEDIIPSLDELLAQIAVMENATSAANTAATRANAAAQRAENLQLDASGMAGDSNKLGGKAPEYFIQAHNLLDNSDFRNPVNQRGLTTYTTGGAYTIDRWSISANAASLNVNSGGVTITAAAEGYAFLRQYIEWKRVAGKTVTFAACTSTGVIAAVTATFPASAPSADTTYGGANVGGMDVYIGGNASYASVQIRTALGGSLGLAWAALYEGTYTADTLPPYIPKGYAAELAECKRYFQRLGENSFASTIGFGIIQAVSDNYIRIFAPLPQELRINPTATFTGTMTVMSYAPSGSTNTTVESIVTAYATNTGVEIVMVPTDTIVAGSHYLVRMNSSSYLLLSADL